MLEAAKKEMTRAGLFDKDSDYGGAIGPAVMELLEVINKQGHSGMSIHSVMSVLSLIVESKPLSPLTDDEDEWMEITAGIEQSTRASAVFRDGGGRPYTIDAYVFREPDGAVYTCKESREYFDLPGYPPETVYLDVQHDAESEDRLRTVEHHKSSTA